MDRQKGFTLLEFVLATTILSIVILGPMSLAARAADVYRNAVEYVDALDQLRSAGESISRELRTATASTLNVSATSPSFSRTDYTSAAGSTAIEGSNNRNVTFTGNVSTSTLSVAYGGTTGTLSNRLSAISFAYYNSTGTAVTSSSNAATIRFVEFTLSLKYNQYSKGVATVQTVSQKSRVTLRSGLL